MIRPLRQRHRHIVIALGVFLPVAFAVGIAARKPVPTVNELPAALTATPEQFAITVWKRSDFFAKTPIEVHLLREEKKSARYAVEFSAGKKFVKPDLLVYWVAGNPNVAGTLPGNAMLLGGFDSLALPLPSEAVTNDGVLVLYSLADYEIVDVSKPARFDDSTK